MSGEVLSPGNGMPLDIFSFRLVSSRRNLELMASLVEKLSERNHRLMALRRDLIDDRSKIVQLLKLLKTQIRHIQLAKDDLEKNTPGIWQIGSAADTALEYVTFLNILVKDARDKAQEISVLHLDAAATAPSNGEFVKKIQMNGDRLELLVTNGGSYQVKPWEDLNNLSELWVEYLDYVAGLSLRHEGLDRGICDIADAMIKELQHYSKSLGALAIPGREGSVGTLPKIAYLRFPEWTVWSLALAAHELWLIAAKSQADIAKYFYQKVDRGELKRSPSYAKWTEEEAKVCTPKTELTRALADAFAVFTIGPAYAYSSLLLQLDPKKEKDQHRAHTILYALDRLNRSDSQQCLDADLKALSRTWEEAVEHAGAKMETPQEGLDDWIQSLLEYLVSLQKLSFPTRTWGANCDRWVDAVLDGAEPLDVSEPMSIRLALNTAWKARLKHLDKADAIADYCYRWCEQLARRPVIVPPRSNGWISRD